MAWYTLSMECSKCHKDKPLEMFHRTKITKCGRRQPCAECRLTPPHPRKRITACRVCGGERYKLTGYCLKHRRERYFTPDKKRRKTLRERYNITPEQYDDQLTKQGAKCFICHRLNVRLVVDHCHSTKHFRGILCDRCNMIIGVWKNDPAAAMRAFQYLS